MGSRSRQNVLSYSSCSRNTGTLLSGRLDINQRGGGQGGEQMQAECAFHTSCSRNKGTLLSGRLEKNQSGWGREGGGGGKKRGRQNVLSYSWLFQKHRNSSVRKVRIKQRGGGRAGSRHRQNMLSYS